MKKLILLFLVLCLTFTCTLGLFSCTPATGGDGGDGGDGDGGGEGDGGGQAPPTVDNSTDIVTPDYKDYGRGTKNLSELVYARPELSTLTADILALAEKVSGSEANYSVLLSELTEILGRLDEAQLMLSLAKISAARDITLAFWQDERAYFAANITELNLASDALLAACADSEHKAALEDALFGYSLDSYLNYAPASPELTELYKKEAEKLFEYEQLSPDTVEITYGEAKGTLNEMLAALAEQYGVGSDKYLSNKTIYTVLYNTALEARREEIFIELLRLRRLIADELGYSSYTELAYKQAGYDYSEAQMIALLEEAKTSLDSVKSLTGSLYSSLSGTNMPKQDYEVTVNDMYSIYREMDSELGDAFAYMLQHGLYDIKEASDVRKTDGFCEYIAANGSPVIFATVSDNVSDYLRLASLFGSFSDGFVSFGFTRSESLDRLYSLCSELLCVTKLNKKLSASSFRYVKILSVYNLLSELDKAIRCAIFEHAVYQLSYDEITSERLGELASSLSGELYGSYGVSIPLSELISEKSITAPMTNEAYITAALGSVQLLALEQSEDGSGAEIFAALLEMSGDSYLDALTDAELDSPFGEDVFTELISVLYAFASVASSN